MKKDIEKMRRLIQKLDTGGKKLEDAAKEAPY